MIYLIYTTLLVAALALVMIFKIVAYILKKGHLLALNRSGQPIVRPFIQETAQIETFSSRIRYTNNLSEFISGFEIGRIEFILDEDRKREIIKRRVVSMGALMLEKGFIKIEELDFFDDEFHPDIKYIELTAKVLKPKD